MIIYMFYEIGEMVTIVAGLVLMNQEWKFVILIPGVKEESIQYQ